MEGSDVSSEGEGVVASTTNQWLIDVTTNDADPPPSTTGTEVEGVVPSPTDQRR